MAAIVGLSLGLCAPGSMAQDSPPPAPAAAEIRLDALDAVEFAIALLAPLVLVVLWKRGVIRPGSFARRRDASAIPWWLLLLCAGLMIVAGGVGAAIGTIAPENDPLGRALAQLGAGAMMIAIGAAMLSWLAAGARPGGGDGLEGLDLRPRLNDLRAGLVAFALTMPVVMAVSVLVSIAVWIATGEPPPAVAHDTLEEIARLGPRPETWLMVLGAVVAAPLAEELMFRVFVQSAMLDLLRRTWTAIFLTSALFALVHLSGGVSTDAAYALIPLFVLSVAMGIAYERTRRPLVPIIVHLLFNATNVALVMLTL